MAAGRSRVLAALLYKAMAVALPLSLASEPAPAEEIDRAALRELVASVLLIEAVSPSGRLQVGSGVVVAANLIATNCHVTRDAAMVWVVKASVRTRAVAQAVDVERDLCLLQVDRLASAPVRLGQTGDLRQGQELAAMGYTGGASLQVSGGKLVAVHPWRGGSIVQADTGFTSGASGGGLFTGDGTLIGLLAFRLRGGAAHYYALPVDWLRSSLAAPPRFEPIAPFGGRTFWEEDAANQPYFLRAASLEQSRQWSRLLTLTQRWTEEEKDDSEPWFVRSLAEEGLGKIDAAIGALERSVALRADDARAWLRLGLLQLRQGQKAQAEQSLAAIAVRFPDAAKELLDAIRKQHAD